MKNWPNPEVSLPTWATSKSVPDERSELEKALVQFVWCALSYGAGKEECAADIMRLLDEHIERKIAERMKNV